MRRTSRQVKVGSVLVGGGAPVSVQAMLKVDTRDIPGATAEIRDLAACGAEIIRLAVPDREAAHAFGVLKKVSPVPLVADIHFNASLALECLASGADKLRLNPGNIGGRRNLEKVAIEAHRAGVPVRVGVNSGSVEKDILEKYGGPVPGALAESALRNARLVEEFGQPDVVISVKSSSVPDTIQAYRLVAKDSDYPLHLGVTGSGPPAIGVTRSCLALGALLDAGIGDTLRISLTGDPREEVRVGKAILEDMGLRQAGPVLISCPTCGRCRVDLMSLVNKVERLLEGFRVPLRVAVMGCEVNGPGEAREADVGLAAGNSRGAIFRRGQIVRIVPEGQFLEALREEMEMLARERGEKQSP